MAPRTRRPHQDVSDLAAHSDALDVIYRRVVHNGNSKTIAFYDWLGDATTVKITLLRKAPGDIFVRIETIEKESILDAQTDRV